ncbi:BPI fold-containing family A member 2-like [Peromyscus leucopus]|uniref:BPI fold-containing family A member 2-like n=1 Tax=Peromyscus leucopus TaxID=10041 RepID=UPI0010A130C1|nr:BPI fold-containing family A member 2-like [Peromyscus leucopus]
MNVPVSFIQEIEIQDKTINYRFEVFLISLDFDRFNFSLSLSDMTIRVEELRTQNLQAGLSSNGNDTEMMMSLAVDASVLMPDDNPRDNTTIALELKCSLMVERESQKSLPYVTMWKCSNETMKDISDSSGRQNAMVDSIIDRVSSSSTERVALVMKKQLSPPGALGT